MRALRGVVAGLLVAAGAAAAAEPETLTVVTWGGAYEAAQRAAIYAPFERASGVELEFVRWDGGVGPLRAHLAEHEPPRWDVVDMLRSDARAACREGLLARFDAAILAPAPDGTPARDDFRDDAVTDCFVSQLIFATVIAYDDRAFPGEKPQTIADFFDVERFPGRRALRDAPVGLFDWALRAYGVPRSQIYDLLSTERGFRLAFRRLDRIRDRLVWWRDGATPARLLAEGEVAMASGYNGRFFHARIAAGAPISIIWDSALLAENVWAMPAGLERRDLAERFIRFATAAEQLGAVANRISYGPTRASAMRRVGLHAEAGVPMRPHLPTAPRHLETALRKDYGWYAATEDLRRRRFEAWRQDEAAPPR
jgi:putative spermidine/putrescine transport system substrate-binding protein